MPVVRPSRSTCGANRVTGHSLKPCRSCFLVDVIFSPASNRTVYERLSSQTVAWPTPSSSSDGQRVTVRAATRSEEHTSELQSREKLVCRHLLEKKKK